VVGDFLNISIDGSILVGSEDGIEGAFGHSIGSEKRGVVRLDEDGGFEVF
jgi:hypothetical protein